MGGFSGLPLTPPGLSSRLDSQILSFLASPLFFSLHPYFLLIELGRRGKRSSASHMSSSIVLALCFCIHCSSVSTSPTEARFLFSSRNETLQTLCLCQHWVLLVFLFYDFARVLWCLTVAFICFSCKTKMVSIFSLIKNQIFVDFFYQIGCILMTDFQIFFFMFSFPFCLFLVLGRGNYCRLHPKPLLPPCPFHFETQSQ